MTEEEIEKEALLKEIVRTRAPRIRVVKKIQRQKEVKISQEQR